MILVKSSGIFREEEKLANMNNYFINIITQLKLKDTKIDRKANPDCIRTSLQNHESLQKIKLAIFH